MTTSVESFISGNYTFTKWSDGSITVEHTEYSFTNNPDLDHATLPAEQVNDLLQFLTKKNG